jgi:hypothetical protein
MTKGRSRIEPEKIEPDVEPARIEPVVGPVESETAEFHAETRRRGEVEPERAEPAPPTEAEAAGAVKAAEVEEVPEVEKIAVVKEAAVMEITDEKSPAEKSLKEPLFPPNVSPDIRESIEIVIRLNFSPDFLRTLETISSEHRNFLDALKKLGPDGIAEVSRLADDEDYILTSKINLLSLINRISKNDFFHNLMKKAGAAIQAIRRLRELLLK